MSDGDFNDLVSKLERLKKKAVEGDFIAAFVLEVFWLNWKSRLLG
jgi:hypothetical protein